MFPKSLRWLAVGAALFVVAAGCKKEVAPAAKPTGAAASAGAELKGAEAVAAPAAASAVQAPAAASVADGEADPNQNVWNLQANSAVVKGGDRVFVLTQGAHRAYDDANKPYRLFAQDVGEVKGGVVVIKEQTGGTFKTSGLFVIPAGSSAAELKVGDMVLAEWASELKHAVVQKIDGEKITVRHTDLPDNWTDDKVVRVLAPREVTRQKEGLQAGTFAFAKGTQGRDEIVLLVGQSGDNWITRQFSQRVRMVAVSDLRPIPLKPVLKPGQLVEVPWIGQVYTGKVSKVLGTRVEVKVDGIQKTDAVIASFGQVAPVEPKKSEKAAGK